MKKIILFLIILISISFVFAASESVFFELDKIVYGPNENFDGNILVNHSGNISVGENFFVGTVSGCTDYSKRISLYNILKNFGMADFSQYTYDVGDPSNSISGYFDGSDKELFAFYIEKRSVNNVSFKILGNGGPFFIDIGDDGIKDWKYLGDRIGWSNKSYSDEYRQDCVPGGSYVVAGPGVCEDISLDFDEFQKESDIRINAIAKKIGTGNLRARIGSDLCDLGNIGSGWTSVSCNVNKDVVNGTNEFRVCFSSDSNNFHVPTCAGTSHYFLSLQKGTYDNTLPSSPKTVSSDGFTNLVDNFVDDCFYDWCVIPMAMSMPSSGDVTLSDLKIEYTGGASLEFYELIQTYSKVDINGKQIQLNAFRDLKTPTTNDGNCSLNISFLGKSWKEDFRVGKVPKAIIVVDSEYSLKGKRINFYGTNSSSLDNKTIIGWSWEFGDNTSANGSIVQHSYGDNGDYTVKLKVRDSGGLEGSSEKIVHIINISEFLENEFPSKLNQINNLEDSFGDLSGAAFKFYDGMNYDTLISDSKNKINELKDEFESVKNNSALSEENRENKYAEIATSLSEVLNEVPKSISAKDSLLVENFKIDLPSNIPEYSKAILNDDKREAIYKFNDDNVDIDFSSTLFEVEFLDGEKFGFQYVEKNIDVSGGNNNVIVEDFRGFDLEDVYIFTEGANYDNSSGVVYWDEIKDIAYAVKSDEIVDINTIIFSDVEIDEDDEIIEDEGEQPIFIYVILGIILIFGIIYINFYKGSGNFKQLTNYFSYGLFHKKLFVTERDKIVLKEFIMNALARGYTEESIKKSLLQKGWNEKQIKIAFKGAL